MRIRISNDREALGRAAASQAAALIRGAIARQGRARILAATGTSQIEFLAALVREPGIAWGEVEMFHLDEYVGLGIDHPASRRRFLFDRLIAKTRIGRYHLLNGEHDPEAVCRQASAHLAEAPIDVAFAGTGASGDLAFNFPPADIKTEKPYLTVRLDECCRRRQVEEGWFACAEDVPERAICISVRQFLRARAVLCVVPGAGNAVAVRRCLQGRISPLAPSSILRTHPDATWYLDRDSAALLPALPPAGESPRLTPVVATAAGRC
jgi:glucosamine-6-phosphate deaminase